MDEQLKLEQDPAIYLREQPSPASPCGRLVKAIDSHDGDHVPMHMLAKVAMRVKENADWRARWDNREKIGRRLVTAGAGLALGNIAAIFFWWLHAHDARITAEANATAAERVEIEYRKGVKEQIEQLQQMIGRLQDKLMRMSGMQPDADGKLPRVDGPLPDHFSERLPAHEDRTDGAPTFSSNSGRTALHVPKLQNGQVRPTPRWHSGPLLQMSPQTLGIGCGLGIVGWDGVDGPQPMDAAMINMMTLRMRTLYPCGQTFWKDNDP